MLKSLPGYDPDVAKNRAEARKIMEKLGYGPDKRLAVTVSTRNIPPYRDPAVILIDQLKEIYIDGELDPIDTTQWYPQADRARTSRSASTSARTASTTRTSNSTRTTSAARSATTPAIATRRSTSWSTSNRPKPTRKSASSWCGRSRSELAEDGARPVIFYPRQATCRQPQVKGLTIMVNSIYNGWRFEDLWLDQRWSGATRRGNKAHRCARCSSRAAIRRGIGYPKECSLPGACLLFHS